MSIATEQVTLLDMFQAIDEPGIELPDELVPYLENVVEHTVPAGEKLYTARSPGYDQPGQASPVDLLFVKTNRVGAASLRAAVLDIRIGFDASGLSLVGESIPQGAFVFPTVRVIYVSRAVDKGQVDQLNAVLRGYGVTEPAFPVPNAMSADAWPKSFTAVVSWWVNGGELPALAISLARDGKGTPNPDKDIRVPGLPVSFGPVTIEAVRRAWDGKGLRIFLVGALRVAGFTFELDQLGIVIPLAGGFIPLPHLMGAGLDVRRDAPQMRITAALRWVGPADPEIAGGLLGLVRVTTPAVEVLGAGGFFRAADGYNSVFLYVEALLGGGRSLFGPPPFTVVGLSGGFGINSSVRPPTAAQLPTFPLVSRLDEAPETPGDQPEPPSPMEVLDSLAGRAGWVRPEDGSYWAAIGVRFTTFRFIETKALALVEFGNRLNLMLLGRTSITFPKNASASGKVHARLTIDLRLAYLSDEHLLSLDVAVAPGSFLFDPACEVTGGIALCVWTGGDRAGDFVISIGGYHPQYALPAHYPTPARLGFRWNPCGRVVIQAQGYTALTPNAIMFGGALAARYELGPLSAWFTAHLDALIQWKPFYLDIAMGISIGVAFTIKVLFVEIRLAIEVGIDLQLWTPPLGGHVSVKIWFISFGFDFGSARAGAPPVPWSEFQTQLPAPIRAKPENGLLLDADEGERRARQDAGEPLLVSSDGFAFSTEAALPASVIRLNGEVHASGAPIGIRPMGLTGVTSEHLVTLALNGLPFDPEAALWTVTATRRDLPRAMWGAPVDKPEPGEPGLEKGLLTGLHFQVPGPDLAPGLGPVTSFALGVQEQEDGWTPLRVRDPRGPAPAVAPDSVGLIVDTLADPATATRRGAVFDALTRLGASPGDGSDGSLTDYARLVGRSMTSAPMTTAAPSTAR